jgi:glycogen debranching enzyme
VALVRAPGGWLRASAPGERFASLFGRDACIAALQLLPADPAVADATLDALGRHLGTRHCPEREEEPGRVAHEVRTSELEAYVAHGWPVDERGLRYYGSIDAGLWDLILYAAAVRAGGDAARHRDRALAVLAWLRSRPAPLTYRRAARSGGLAHQWWRDVAADLVGRSTHGDVGDDGRHLTGTVGIAAVQALAWRALQDAAETLEVSAAADAAAARQAFFDHYVAGRALVTSLDDRGAHRRPNADAAFVLWTGILPRPIADDAATALLAPESTTDHGLRSLPSDHAAFDPAGYHTGAVWPFLSWFAWGGIRDEHPGDAARLRDGTLRALGAIECFAELYGVGDSGPFLVPEACRTMAVTVGAMTAWHHGWDGRSWLG